MNMFPYALVLLRRCPDCCLNLKYKNKNKIAKLKKYFIDRDFVISVEHVHILGRRDWN